MKKYIRTLLIFSVLFAFTFGFASCSDDDGYSLDKRWENIVTVNKIDDNTYDFTLDNGDKLWVAAPIGLNLKPKYNRAIINYTILSDKRGEYDHSVKLNGFYDVLTKGVIYIPEDNKVKQDSIGNDPIKVHSIWQGGGYLNIGFGYNTGETKAHMINLVSADSELSKGDDVVKLEFRHNKSGDPEKYGIRGYVSFDLSPYRIPGRDKVTFEISAKDFGASGEIKTYKVEYKYGEVQEPDPEE